jgi:hypothetical protein
LEKQFDSTGVLDTFANLARMVSLDTIVAIGRQLMRGHKPASFNYAAKFGITDQARPVKEAVVVEENPEPIVAMPEPPAYQATGGEVSSNPACKNCQSENLSIVYGKFGYYFKCSACDGNTPIKIGCGIDGHNERIRKEGQRFFRECADCGSSSIYFVNP